MSKTKQKPDAMQVWQNADPPQRPPAPSLAGMLATAALMGLVAAGASAVPTADLPDAVLPLLFLVAVLLSAMAFGFWTGLLAALVAFGALNFLFTEPLYTFHVTRPQDVFALFVFLLVAALAGLLAGRLHDRAEAARTRAETLAVLGALSSDLAQAETTDQALERALKHLARLCGGTAVAVDLATGEPVLRASGPAQMASADLQAAERAFRLGRAEPAPAQGWPGATLNFLPLAEGGLVLGHSRVSGHEGARSRLAIAALVEQLRLALQRLDYAEKAHRERLRAETEMTRSALLSSLSHDLRTPLATILGAASALKDLDASLDHAARTDLLAAIEEEAARLNRYVGNLLQMTRLEQATQPHLVWLDLNDIAEAAVARALRAWPGVVIQMALADDMPMLRAEAGLVEQALFNLIDNALHHGVTPVMVASTLLPDGLAVTVTDQGKGPPQTLRDWLAGQDMRPAAGQRGLGLAVAKGIAHLHGGHLTATANCFTLILPKGYP